VIGVEVLLNGRTVELPDAASVTAAVAVLATAGPAGSAPVGRGFAVAVNGAVVPRSVWPVTTLSAGDRVEVLSAVQGG
jgi:sulfur carrier protein